MIERATVTTPEMIGLLAWWSVVLAAPVILLRRRSRRRSGAPRTRGSVGRLAKRIRRARRAPLMPSGQSSRIIRSSEPDLAFAPTSDPGSAADDASNRRGPASALATASSDGTRSCSQSAVSPRLPSGTLDPLCRYVDFQRRLELAASELRLRLARSPEGRWRVEPYPLTGERRNTFVILGETGIFVVSATYAPGHWDDVIAASRLASKIQVLLPGYGGKVQPAICHPFTSTQPRIWHRPDAHGNWISAWLIGGDSVIEWLTHFGPRHGLNAADLARFDELAKPNWLNGAIPTPASWPQTSEIHHG